MRQLDRIQNLRGLAALLVVLGHGLTKVDRICELSGCTPPNLRVDATFGVDIFFVISGFIMYHTSRESFGLRGAPVNFWARRILRIVPLYWLCTFAVVGLRAINPESAGSSIGLQEILKSLFFVPYLDDEGLLRPVLSLGWTLNFEMLFYAVFGLSLFVRREIGILLIVAGLLTLVVSGLVWMPANPVLLAWTSPILIEFLLGIGIAILYERMAAAGRLLPIPAPFALGLCIVVAVNVGFAVDAGWLVPDIGWRPWHWAAAAAIVALNVMARPAARTTHAASVMKRLGDSSYSLYLTHPFVLLVMARIWMSVVHSPALLPLFYVLSVLACALCGWLVFACIERPMLDIFRKRRRDRQRPGTILRIGAGQSGRVAGAGTP